MNREQRREWRRDIQRRKRKGKAMTEYVPDPDDISEFNDPVEPDHWLADEATEESQDDIPSDDIPADTGEDN